MNFKDDYKKQVNKILLNNDAKTKIIGTLNKPKRMGKMPYFITAAAVVCALIAVSFYTPVKDLFVLRDEAKQPEITEDTVSPNIAENYSVVYEKIKELTDKVSDSEAVDDGYIAYAEGIITGSAVATDKATAPTYNSANKGGASANSKPQYSETTIQVEGVDEADVIKTDGEYIYVLSKRNYKLRIIKAGKEPKQVATIPLDSLPSFDKNLYLSGDRLVIYGTRYVNDKSTAKNDNSFLYLLLR